MDLDVSNRTIGLAIIIAVFGVGILQIPFPSDLAREFLLAAVLLLGGHEIGTFYQGQKSNGQKAKERLKNDEESN